MLPHPRLSSCVLYFVEFRGLSVADSARKAGKCTAVVDLETSLIRYQRARLSGLYVHRCDSVTVAAALLNGRSGDPCVDHLTCRVSTTEFQNLAHISHLVISNSLLLILAAAFCP